MKTNQWNDCCWPRRTNRLAFTRCSRTMIEENSWCGWLPQSVAFWDSKSSFCHMVLQLLSLHLAVCCFFCFDKTVSALMKINRCKIGSFGSSAWFQNHLCMMLLYCFLGFSHKHLVFSDSEAIGRFQWSLLMIRWTFIWEVQVVAVKSKSYGYFWAQVAIYTVAIVNNAAQIIDYELTLYFSIVAEFSLLGWTLDYDFLVRF